MLFNFKKIWYFGVTNKYFNIYFLYLSNFFLYNNFFMFLIDRIYKRNNFVFYLSNFNYFFLKKFINLFAQHGKFLKSVLAVCKVLYLFFYSFNSIYLIFNKVFLLVFMQFFCCLDKFYLLSEIYFFVFYAVIAKFFNISSSVSFAGPVSNFFFEVAGCIYKCNGLNFSANISSISFFSNFFKKYYESLSASVKYSRLDRRIWKQRRRHGLRYISRLSYLFKNSRFRFFLLWLRRDVVSSEFETFFIRLLFFIERLNCNKYFTIFDFLAKQSSALFLNNFLTGKRLIS